MQRDLLLDSFAAWFAKESFASAQRPLAERVLRYIFAVNRDSISAMTPNSRTRS